MTARGRHDLFVYENDDELAETAGDFLRCAPDEEAVALAVFDARKSFVLREALGSTVGDVTFIDRDTHYTRPEAALATYDATLRRLLRGPATSVRLFGELPLAPTREDRDGWIAYEAILNRAFAEQPVWIVCGYDARELPESMIEAGLRTHPQGHHDDGLGPRPEYQDPASVVRAMTPAPEPLPEDLHSLPVDGDARAFRDRLVGAMSAAGVPDEDARNMLIAAGEALANAWHHGDGVRSLRAGAVDGRFVLELADHGPGVGDPLAGYLPPHRGAHDGAGLWVARQLTHRLELLQSPDGLTLRLWV